MECVVTQSVVAVFGRWFACPWRRGVHDSIFNNFLSDTYHLTADQRGLLEFPRETPGFMTVIVLGILSALPVTRVGMTGTLLFGLGMIGMAMLGGIYPMMMVAMVIGSTGMHLLQPVGSASPWP